MLYRSTRDARHELESPVVAIGNFDGVHRGHAAVVDRAVAEARARGVDAVVLTFDPHPVLYFRPQTPEFRLTTLEQRATLLTALGVRAVVAARFDAALAGQTPAEFVDEILAGDLGASAVLVGEDFRFGRGRAGDVAMLRELGAAHGIDVISLDQVRVEAAGVPVSSTRVRAALAEGDLRTVEELLGRPYAITGRVQHGDAIGRTFGFPTANLRPDTPLLPPDGIYATRLWDEAAGGFVAATYIGTRPSVGGTERVVEAYCLDAPAELDLYDRVVELEFWGRIRGDQHFADTDALIAQMHRDVARVREIASER